MTKTPSERSPLNAMPQFSRESVEDSLLEAGQRRSLFLGRQVSAFGRAAARLVKGREQSSHPNGSGLAHHG